MAPFFLGRELIIYCRAPQCVRDVTCSEFGVNMNKKKLSKTLFKKIHPSAHLSIQEQLLPVQGQLSQRFSKDRFTLFFPFSIHFWTDNIAGIPLSTHICRLADKMTAGKGSLHLDIEKGGER